MNILLKLSSKSNMDQSETVPLTVQAVIFFFLRNVGINFNN